MKKDWRPYALHILECIDKICYIQEKGDINNDVVLYDATLRNLQTLSEATRHLPEYKIQNYASIPWKSISGFRNILVHDYLGDINPTTVLTIVKTHIFPLKQAIEAMLKE